MAKGENQKLKLLYLVKILSEETDDGHFLTVQDMIDRLASCGVSAERKALYRDLDELRTFGLDILSEQIGRNVYYHLGHRDFELPELKLLVDSVQSAKFITEKKSGDLIKKLEALVSKYEARHLQRQVVISGRVKTMNESVYYNVDAIHEAISSNRQLRFHYFQWTVKKKMELRRDGAWYVLSPWGLIWDDEYYYMVAYDAADEKVKHYRVDKMLNIKIEDAPRQGKKAFREFNLPRYSKGLFGMFSGERTTVRLECANDMAGVIIDRFGKEISLRPVDEAHFSCLVEVAVSQQFFGWIFALGEGVKITEPHDVVEQLREEAKRLYRQYLPEEAPEAE
ncbi:MAG: WYL domain-containing protein [Ruminiclostridium sp.]|nr:WYL domain-containing protein [Ruminiclostridium sp.]